MKRKYLSLIILATALSLTARQPAADVPEADDEETVEATDSIDSVVDDDTDLRTGYVEIPGEATDIDIPVPGFIHQNSNRIILNGADWSGLRKAFRESAQAPVSIVHIGDSHIQGGYSTATTRELLQYDFGNAGRGLIMPLKLSGTNQPVDYVFQSRNPWIANKLMSPTWRQTVGFTGTSIRPSSPTSEVTVGTSETDDYNPFSSLTLFHSGKLTVNNVTDASGHQLAYRAIPSKDYTQLLLPSPQTRVTVSFSSAGDLTLFGASLSGDRPGVYYHEIGNNGASYEVYNRIGSVGLGLAPLKPDLVIISMGTNEACGRLNTAAFTRSVDRLVRNIRSSNPEALILLTTPMEFHRSVTSTKKVRVKGKRRRGRKARYRTVNRTSRSYAVNRNVAPLRQAILDYGKQNGVAVYDWYEVSGGAGASNSWIDHGLFARDRVHHSRAGYTLEGRLLYDALMDALRTSD